MSRISFQDSASYEVRSLLNIKGDGNYFLDKGRRRCPFCGKQLWRCHWSKNDMLTCRNDRCARYRQPQDYVGKDKK